MRLALLALAVATGPPVGDTTFNARMRDSIAAAQALQGPLDGHWTLYAGVRAVLVLAIIDPAGGGPLQAAWRDPSRSADAGLGVVSEIMWTGRRLRLTFTRPEKTRPTTIDLVGDPGLGWRGRLDDGGSHSSVVLRRD